MSRRWRDLATRALTARRAGGHRVLYLVAAAAFVAAALIGWSALPDLDQDPRWWLIAVGVVAAAPLTALVNGAEYAVTARLVGYRVGTVEATRIAILASAANLLPLPGAVAVRAQALRRRGATTGRAVWATAVAGAVWVGVALLAAGILQLDGDHRAAALTATLLGVVVVAGAAVAAWTLTRGLPVGPVLALVAVEVASVAVGAGRYLLVVHALGFAIEPRQAIALAVAGILASLIGILPGGLGVRELLAGAIAPLVGLAASVGVIGSAVDRLIGLPALAVMALAVSARPPPDADQ
ncbi:MAG: hypothetical protein U5K29_08835 [Acidimicrobiales bacterium]|nr:hypothetical protein [Acidimicrobiales bacterium]